MFEKLHNLNLWRHDMTKEELIAKVKDIFDTRPDVDIYIYTTV